MVAATGADVRVEEEDRDILRAPLLIDSRLTRGDVSGLDRVDCAGEALSGMSSGADDRWCVVCDDVAGGLKSTQT